MTRPDRAMLLEGSLDDLMLAARAVRDRAHGTRITYSPKVFIPLTMLCRDQCGYCTFAQPPARLEKIYLLPDDVLSIARQGARRGCHEALFTLGERPEERYEVAREFLREHVALRVEIENKVRTALGVPLLPVDAPAKPAKGAKAAAAATADDQA